MTYAHMGKICCLYRVMFRDWLRGSQNYPRAACAVAGPKPRCANRLCHENTALATICVPIKHMHGHGR